METPSLNVFWSRCRWALYPPKFPEREKKYPGNADELSSILRYPENLIYAISMI